MGKYRVSVVIQITFNMTRAVNNLSPPNKKEAKIQR